MLLFFTTSACPSCEFMTLTRGLDLSECLSRAVVKHREQSRTCQGSQMKLMQFRREEVPYAGSAHEQCPVCDKHDAKLIESGIMLVYECKCGHIFVACRHCNSVMEHHTPGFKYYCSSKICGRHVDFEEKRN